MCDTTGRRKMRYCRRGKRIYPYEVGEICPICGAELMERDFGITLSDAILKLLELGYDVRNAHGGYDELSYMEKVMSTNISISHSKTLYEWWTKPRYVEDKSNILLSVTVTCMKMNPLGKVSSSLEDMEQYLLDIVSLFPENKDENKERHYGSAKNGKLLQPDSGLSGDDGGSQYPN